MSKRWRAIHFCLGWAAGWTAGHLLGMGPVLSGVCAVAGAIAWPEFIEVAVTRLRLRNAEILREREDRSRFQ